ncbi:MAG: hypothetical protein K0S47_4307 [Herbinix sp.]|jgi:hypothetical protein|nr:hypothetical protein [Herbinix sp.]
MKINYFIEKIEFMLYVLICSLMIRFCAIKLDCSLT